MSLAWISIGALVLVLMPHIGWPTDQAYERFADASSEVLLAYLDGRDVPRFTA